MRADTKTAAAERPQGISRRDFKNYQQLVQRAVDVFGSELKASTWLSTPQNDLNGEVPLELARRQHYEPAVFDEFFGRVEHGIYF